MTSEAYKQRKEVRQAACQTTGSGGNYSKQEIYIKAFKLKGKMYYLAEAKQNPLRLEQFSADETPSFLSLIRLEVCFKTINLKSYEDYIGQEKGKGQGGQLIGPHHTSPDDRK